jgi:opacity protein-like surface antigen
MRAAVGALGLSLLAASATSRAEPPPRPRLPEAPALAPLPWEHHLDLGVDGAFVVTVAQENGAGQPTPVRFRPAAGLGAHLSIDVLRSLRFSAYLVDARPALTLPEGALGPSGSIASDSAHIFRLGARFSPTLRLTDRIQVWAAAGLGWGRVEYPRMSVTERDRAAFMIRERADSVLDLPIGIGASFEVVPRWLRLEFELSYGIGLSQQGTGIDAAQAIDSEGRKRMIDGLPKIEGSVVQTVGVSLLL